MSDATDTVEPGSPAEPEFNNRGFAFWEPVGTDYGAEVVIAESSAAMGPHLWLRVNQPPPEHPGQLEEARAVAHCTLEQAEEIRDRLDAAIKFSKERWGDPGDDDAGDCEPYGAS